MEHSEAGALQIEDYKPFDLHYELAYAIKAALQSCLPRRDPDVRLEIPFDLLIFNGGLKLAEAFVRKFHGHDISVISSSFRHSSWMLSYQTMDFHFPLAPL